MSFNSDSSDDSHVIVDYFSKFFASVYSRKKCNGYEFEVSNTVDINSCDISVLDVFDAISSLDNHLSPGPDKISVMFLKQCCCVLSPILKSLFSASICSGKFPDVWKLSYVTPIFKNGDKSLVTNYRPISKISLVAKVFESIIDSKIKPLFQNVLIASQHGFISDRSTVSNLLVYEHHLRSALEGSCQVDAIYTDFSKAFDRVNHEILIYKLQCYGIFGNLLEWFKSYLSNRRQIVKIKNYMSAEVSVTSGVPQGSHLAPLLFNLFVNDLNSVINNSKFLLYADDLKIYRIIESLCDCEKLQEDLDRLEKWCCVNGMELNAEKCKVMRFYKKKNILNNDYKISDNILEKVDLIKDLGVFLDS